MRYIIAPHIEVRTENAAKPESQASNFLLQLLHHLDHGDSTFDYGCGKLRYHAAIAQTTDFLISVDSEVQLSRIQRLRNQKTSIRNIFEKSNCFCTINEVEFEELNSKCDRGFCINVLFAIPCFERRQHVMKVIRSKLHRHGECLFVVQYRNSDFTRMMKLPNATPYLDGFLIDSLRGYSFYGLISPGRLQSSLKGAGFCVRETVLNDGSAYCWVTPTDS